MHRPDQARPPRHQAVDAFITGIVGPIDVKVDKDGSLYYLAVGSGAKFRCVVSNSAGAATSNEAVLRLVSNRPPTASIANPPAGSTYIGGQTINYSGAGADPEDGTLAASAFTWVIVFHHDSHTHPFLGPITGTTSGSFTTPTQGETSSNVWYRIHLYVKDSQGMIDSTFRDVLPVKVNVTLAANPAGLQLLLDGQPVTSPFTNPGDGRGKQRPEHGQPASAVMERDPGHPDPCARIRTPPIQAPASIFLDAGKKKSGAKNRPYQEILK